MPQGNESLLPRQTFLESSTRPLSQVDEIIGLMEVSTFYGLSSRLEFQPGRWLVPIRDLARNQARMASTVD